MLLAYVLQDNCKWASKQSLQVAQHFMTWDPVPRLIEIMSTLEV